MSLWIRARRQQDLISFPSLFLINRQLAMFLPSNLRHPDTSILHQPVGSVQKSLEDSFWHQGCDLWTETYEQSCCKRRDATSQMITSRMVLTTKDPVPNKWSTVCKVEAVTSTGGCVPDVHADRLSLNTHESQLLLGWRDMTLKRKSFFVLYTYSLWQV